MLLPYENINNFDVRREGDALSWLTLDAAGSIDNAYLGRKFDTFPVKKLSNLLGNYARDLGEDPRSSDPFAGNVLWQVIRKYKDNEEIRQTNELALKISLVALELKNVNSSPRKRLELLRGFCIDLCKEIENFMGPLPQYLEKVA